MTNHKIQFVGNPCGHHGNYTFYKGFRYSLHGRQKILALGEFFFLKIWEEEAIISIGETQLIWEDKTSGQFLVSLRIYFLPENTPDGRTEDHGQHEVVSLSEKVVLRAEDVVSIMRCPTEVKWDAGLKGIFEPQNQHLNPEDTPHYTSPLSHSLDIKEILKEKVMIGDVTDADCLHAIVLNYDTYCRMRGLLKRLEGIENETMKSKTVKALGGFVVPSRKTRLLFCRDVFDYPELEGHDLLCNHLAPKLQGRPRKKKFRHDSESESSETSEDNKPRLKGKPGLMPKNYNTLIRRLKPSRNYILPNQIKNELHLPPPMGNYIEHDFMTKLYKFMKARNTPITRLPSIGYKQLNIFDLFTRVQQIGGFEAVGQKKLWRHVFEMVVGNTHGHHKDSPNFSSNVNTLKKHYERLLYAYEKHLLEEQKRIFGIDTKSLSAKAAVRLLSKHSKYAKQLSSMSSERRYGMSNQNRNRIRSDSGEPSVSILQVPKVNMKSDAASISSDLSRRPEITITPIPRSLSSNTLTNAIHSAVSAATAGSGGLTSLELADLMALNVNLNSSLGSMGVSALQNLAKIAERYEKAGGGLEQPHKKFKYEEGCGGGGMRMNGTSQRNSSPHMEHKRHLKSHYNNLSPPEGNYHKSNMPVPDLVSADLLRQMNALENNKLIHPAHQSTKTINALAALLPQTSIFPAPAPAAHQNANKLSPQKHQADSTKPEPVFQSLSVYSQSKRMYENPNPSTKEYKKDNNVNSNKRRSSPEIEILDLRLPTDSKRLELELLDLSTRRDITVSAVPKPGPSPKNQYQQSQHHSPSRIPPPSVSIKSTDNGKSLQYMSNQAANNTALLAAMSAAAAASSGRPKSPHGAMNNNQMTALASLLAAQGMNPAMAGMNMGGSSPFMNYLMSNMTKASPPQPPQGAMPPLPMFPGMDAAMLHQYYSMIPGMMPPTSQMQGASSNAAAIAAVQQAAAAAQLAHLSSLGLAGLQNISPETMASLGIYKNYMPQGSLPAPHFLSGLMSPGSQNPSTSK